MSNFLTQIKYISSKITSAVFVKYFCGTLYTSFQIFGHVYKTDEKCTLQKTPVYVKMKTASVSFILYN
jgi:hypothetical protein